MITYEKGNLLNSNCGIICQQVNCQGVMGAGIAKAIRDRWSKVYIEYINACKNELNKLGNINCVSISEEGKNPFYIINMFAQERYGRDGKCYTNYDSFRACCKKIKCLPFSNLTIGFPDHIGCGLAGGDWTVIKEILEEEFGGEDWQVEIWKL